jgi:stage II sporulation protein AA (anti-sigma F factor antagonist)
MEFTCSAHQSGQHLSAAVAGDIDLAVHPRFQAEAKAWAGKHTDVVLDCSGVTFMDSMGLLVLVELRRDVTEAGHAFVLANPSTPVSRVLELAGLHEVFEVTFVPEEAVESMAA